MKNHETGAGRPAAALFAIGLAGLAFGAAPVSAAEPVSDAGALVRIERSLNELVRIQRTRLFVDRLAVEERRLEPLRNQLRGERQTGRGLKSEIERIDDQLEQARNSLLEAQREGRESEASSLREDIEQIERYMEMRERELADSDRRVIELENDLARARRKVDDLEQTLDELLAALAEGR